MLKLIKFAPFMMALAGGMIAAMALPPAHYIAAFFAGFSVFFLAFELIQSKRGAFFVGWLWGFGYFGIGLSWIGNALLVEGNGYAWAWPLAVMGLPAGLAIFTGLASLCARQIFQHYSIALRYVGFVVAIATAEWLRGHILTGFPWNLAGSIWANNLEMLQVLWPTSIYGLSLLTLFWAGLPALMWRARRNPCVIKPVLLVGLISVIATYGYGLHRLQTAEIGVIPDTYAHIIQPNIQQHEKWQAGLMDRNFETHLELSSAKTAQSGTHLVVWPETAITQGYLDSEIAREKIQNMLQGYNGEAHLLTGALRYNKERDYFNSIVNVNAKGAVQSIYDKFHLVPFGEYIPFQNLIPIKTVSQFSGFKKGAGPQTQKITGTLSINPLVCYEIIFSGNVSDGDHADLIVNVTNDAWYGVSAGPYQHLAQAKFRAIEEGITVLRAANTGVSVIISPLGMIESKTDLFQKDSLTSPLHERISKKSMDKTTINLAILITQLGFLLFICSVSHRKYRINRKN